MPSPERKKRALMTSVEPAPAEEVTLEGLVYVVKTEKEYETFLDSLTELNDASRSKSIQWFSAHLSEYKASWKKLRQNQTTVKPGRKITTPGCTKVADYEHLKPFDIPVHYIKSPVHREYVTPLQLSNGDHVFYDVSEEDIAFLQENVNETLIKESNCSIMDVEENFIRLINNWENASGTGPAILPDNAFAIGRSLPTLGHEFPLWALKSIYNYWMERRRILQRPLLRKYWGTQAHRPPAYCVFQMNLATNRPSVRRQKRTQQEQRNRLQTFKEDLSRVENLLSRVIERDCIKLMISELNDCMFDQMRKELIDPSYVSPYWTYLKETNFRNLFGDNQWISNLLTFDNKIPKHIWPQWEHNISYPLVSARPPSYYFGFLKSYTSVIPRYMTTRYTALAQRTEANDLQTLIVYDGADGVVERRTPLETIEGTLQYLSPYKEIYAQGESRKLFEILEAACDVGLKLRGNALPTMSGSKVSRRGTEG